MQPAPPCRKHSKKESYTGYTQQFPLFEPLGEEELRDLALGSKTFRSRHPETLVFPDPFLGTRVPEKKHPLSALRIVVGSDTVLARAADQIVSAIRSKWGFEVQVVGDSDAAALIHLSDPLLLLGGSHENRCSLEVARKYQTGLFCSEHPGPEGWGLTSHWELEKGFAPRIQLAFDAMSMETAVAAFLENSVLDGAPPTLRWAHEISPAPGILRACEKAAPWLSPENFEVWFPVLRNWVEGGRTKPYREVFQEFYETLQRENPDARDDKPFGLPYNSVALDLGIDAIRIFQATGQAEAFELFRETLRGYWNYLQTSSPTIYVSDMDFRLAELCAYWSWIEHSPEITEEEREIFPKLLLALTRMVRDYYRKIWKETDIGGACGKWKTRHNHQTFKCSGLAQAWRYFARWDIPDRPSWREEADLLFSAINPASFKQSENAGNYETFVPEHTLVWAECTDFPIEEARKEALAMFALREWITRDNFLYPIDYGDSDPSLAPSRPFEVSAWIGDATLIQRQIRLFEGSCKGMFDWKVPNAVRNFSGLHRSGQAQDFAGGSGWEVIPLDPTFGPNLHLAGAAGLRFDKLAWRSGWAPSSDYLAIEGIGNETVSHAHNEANGILRMNFGGRIWAVSNGYGKRAGIADAAKAFSTRQKGPEELNMLIVRNPETGKAAVPPVNALLVDHGTSPLPFSLTSVAGYAGVDWLRLVLALPGAGFVVLDRVLLSATECPPTHFELQWNLLGERLEADGRTLLDQSGLRIEVCLFGSSSAEWKESPVAVWRRLIETGAYPHTRAMPHHLVLHPTAQLGMKRGAYGFVTGFWMEGKVEKPAWQEAQSALSLGLAGSNCPEDSSIQQDWGSIASAGGQLRVALNPAFRLPV